MAKKIMLWPSARSKFIKDGNMKLIYKSLIVISVVMIFLNYYLFGFIYGVKLLLMILLAVIVTVESEILFYTIDKDITREESKTLIQKSYPKITALIYVLLIPIGTPLWLVGVGAILATLLGKLLFGGFHHMVFHSSLVGVIFVTLGWPGLVDSVPFATSFDNYILELIFDNAFFNETLSIGTVFAPESVNILDAMLGLITEYNIFFINGIEYSVLNTFLGVVPGVIGGALLLMVVAGVLVFKKAINYITPLAMVVSFIGTALIITLSKNYDMSYVLLQLFSGSFLFVALFIATDPITSPIDNRGKIVYGVIAGALTMIIRHAGTNVEGVYFAVGFMMMLTPMINQAFKAKPKKKALPKKEGT